MIEHKKYKIKMVGIFGTFILASFDEISDTETYLNSLRKDIKDNSYITDTE